MAGTIPLNPGANDLRDILNERYNFEDSWCDLAIAFSNYLDGFVDQPATQLAAIRDPSSSYVTFPITSISNTNPTVITISGIINIPKDAIVTVKSLAQIGWNSLNDTEFTVVSAQFSNGITTITTSNDTSALLPFSAALNPAAILLFYSGIANVKNICKMLGLSYDNNLLANDEWIRIAEHVAQHWSQKGTDFFIDFLGWIKNVIFTKIPLWTKDYKNFVDISQVPDDENTLNFRYYVPGMYYPTAHCGLEYNALAFTEPLDQSDVYNLFYKLAPIHLVLYYLAAVFDATEAIQYNAMAAISDNYFSTVGTYTVVAPSVPLSLDGATNGRILVPRTPPPYGFPLIVDNSGTFGPLTTTNANDLLVLCVSAEIPSGTPPMVTSITGNGISWTRRSRFTPGIDSSYLGAISADVEIWYASASTPLTNAIFNITFQNAVRSAIMCVFAVSNVNLANPWAIANTLEAENDSANSPTNAEVPGLSLDAANSFVFCFGVGYTNPVFSYGVMPQPWIFIQPNPNNGSGGAIQGFADSQILVAGSNALGSWNQATVDYQLFSGPISGLTVTSYGATGFFLPSWVAVVDALQ